MSVQNISGRRGGVIAGAAALVLLVLVAAFDNQWTETWRARRTANSWLEGPVRALDALNWRATPLTGESSRMFAGTLTAAVLAALLTGLLALLVCRGVGSERGRWALFFGTWLVTALGTSVALIAGVLIEGDPAVKLSDGTVYSTLLDGGFQFGLYAGWLVGFAAVLAYGSTPGLDGIVEDAEYDTPSGYDYGTSVPAASYSYSPTSPYGSGSGSGSGRYGDYGGYDGRDGYEGRDSRDEYGDGYGGGEETTQISPPQDPYSGRGY